MFIASVFIYLFFFCSRHGISTKFPERKKNSYISAFEIWIFIFHFHFHSISVDDKPKQKFQHTIWPFSNWWKFFPMKSNQIKYFISLSLNIIYIWSTVETNNFFFAYYRVSKSNTNWMMMIIIIYVMQKNVYILASYLIKLALYKTKQQKIDIQYIDKLD